MKKLRKYPILLLPALFLALITAADLLEPAKTFSELENRYLKQRPSITLSGLASGEFAQSYESYLNDQFIGRDAWISLKSRTESLLLKTENNGVVYGRGGRLFEKYTQYPQGQLEKNLAHLHNFLQGEGSAAVMLVPSAYELYPVTLPKGLKMVDQREKIQEIYNGFSGQAETIDLYPVLEEAKEEEIYYRTDHHWTTQGAYLAYVEFCRSQGLTPVKLDALTAHQVPGFLGTLFSKCKKAGTPGEILTWYELPIGRVTADGVEKPAYLDESALDTRDKYAAFLWGNGGVTVLEADQKAERPGGGGKILVIKDSFANCFAPFLTENYDQVWVVDLRSLPVGLTELAAREEFDQVLVLYHFVNFASDTNFYRLGY